MQLHKSEQPDDETSTEERNPSNNSENPVDESDDGPATAPDDIGED